MTTPRPPGSASEVLSRVQRGDRSRLLAALASRFGDLDLAEDCIQDAFAAALETWPRTGAPDSPAAWLMTTAKRKAIDRLRRESALTERLARLRVEEERHAAAPPPIVSSDSGGEGSGEIPDERLALFFACSHPTLKLEEQIALTLRYLGGLSTLEIANAFLVPVSTMQQRLVRAKKRIRETRIPVRIPAVAQLPRRLPAVLRVVYLIFTEGYAAATGDSHVRADLTAEAIRLARVLSQLCDDEAEVTGLLALLLLTEARSPARTDDAGLPVALEDQDRAMWTSDLLEEGLILAERSAAAAGAGAYAVQAAIAAVHAEGACFDDTDWAQIVVLYEMLYMVEPGPVVDLGRAIAIGRRDGFEAGLERLDELAVGGRLEHHHPFHTARATTLEKLGRHEDARAEWELAHQLTANQSERMYFEKRWWGCSG